MELRMDGLVGFSVVEKLSAGSHARIGEAPQPPNCNLASALTRFGEVPGNAPAMAALFARDGEAPGGG